jgi:Tfp pilus assembly protein PilO
MKIKILLVPLAIAIVIVILIWWVYPSYTNGVDGVKEKLSELSEKKSKLADLSGKSLNVDALSQELASMPEDIQTLYSFIPEEIKEEEIVDNLSFFASKSKVAISEITVSQPKLNVPLSLPDETSLLLTPPLPTVEIVKTKVKILGNYDNIKDFFDNISKLNRYNNFTILNISKVGSSPESEIPGNILTAEADINFNILEKAKLSDSNIGDAVFSKNSLDKETISEIKNQKNSNTFELNIDRKGKANPFIP